MSKFQVVIGRSECLDIVDLALDVPAKIDTGAFRSSVHASGIKVSGPSDKQVLTCKLLGHPCSPVARPFSTPDFNKVVVMNSFGQEEERYEVVLKIKMGPKIFKTSFTLADRSNNLFPILAGRTLLKNRYLIDVAKTNVDRSKLKKTFGILTPTDAEDLED